MQSFSYPVRLAPDRRNGYVVITQGDDLADALIQAADCLEEAMAGRIRREDEISRPAKGQRLIAVPGVTAAKAALYLALRQTGTAGAKLASLLRCPKRHVRPLLDPGTPPASPTSNAPFKPLENNWLSRSTTPPETHSSRRALGSYGSH